MNKTYSRINWENYPSQKTAIDENNLNKIDMAVNEIDDRVISHDTTKADKLELQELVKDVTLDENTGIFTFTKVNGGTFTIDTKLEKLAVNFEYNATSQKLIIHLSDGTSQEVDLTSLISEYEFNDTDTIDFTVVNGKVHAIVKEGSIQEKHLRPNYLADIKVESAKAIQSVADAKAEVVNAQTEVSNAKDEADRAKGEADRAEGEADRAKSEADRARNIAGGDFIPTSEKSKPDGIATLDENGKVPRSQMDMTQIDLAVDEVNDTIDKANKSFEDKIVAINKQISDANDKIDEKLEEINKDVEKAKRDAILIASGMSGSTTVFNADGSITETFIDGREEITQFNDDGTILKDGYTDDTLSFTETTTFNTDGSITIDYR